MRDINEQLSVIMHRADSIKEKESLRKYMVAQSLSLCACIALLVMTCCYLPRLTLVADTSLPVQFGSLILNTSYMSYVIVGFLAFVLGVLAASLAITRKKMKQKESN